MKYLVLTLLLLNITNASTYKWEVKKFSMQEKIKYYEKQTNKKVDEIMKEVEKLLKESKIKKKS